MVRAEYHVRCPDAPLGNKVLKSVTLFAAFEATVVTDRVTALGSGAASPLNDGVQWRRDGGGG